MRRRTRWTTSLVGLLVLTLAVVACDGTADEGGASVPDDLTAWEDDRVRFGVPDGFVETPTGEELISGLTVEFLHDPSGEQPLPEQVTLRYAHPDDPDFDIAAWPAFAIGPLVGDDTMTDRAEVEVPGAREALQVQYELHYDQLDEPVSMVALGAIIETADGPVIADLRYTAVESEFDDEVADTVLRSLRGT